MLENYLIFPIYIYICMYAWMYILVNYANFINLLGSKDLGFMYLES